MLKVLFYWSIVSQVVGRNDRQQYPEDNAAKITVLDLTRATTWKEMSQYYYAVERLWKICLNCGVPALGTAMHLDHGSEPGSMHPAIIPTEFLLTRLCVIDLSQLAKVNPTMVLTLDVALQWMPLKYDPKEPTLLLFKFGWVEEPVFKKTCVCEVPGISYELAEWIAANLSHVVGVATDAPTLESEQTREFSTRTISNLLGKSGIYIIENVNMKRRIPDTGCMAIAMPLMMLNSNYVPTRLTALCPTHMTDRRVTIALKKMALSVTKRARVASRVYDINLEEIMS